MYNTNKSSLMQYKNLINQSKDLIKKSIEIIIENKKKQDNFGNNKKI
jgi:hypothetical protein